MKNKISVWFLMYESGEPLDAGFTLEYIKNALKHQRDGRYTVMEFSCDVSCPSILEHDPAVHFRYEVLRRKGHITAHLYNRSSYFCVKRVKL